MRLLALPVLALLVCLPAAALAQPSEQDTAAARALFEEGRRLAGENRWGEAVDRFQRALARRSSPAIRYNLAVALEHEGHLVDSSEQLRAALLEAGPRDAARRAAQELLSTIEPRIARLTVVVGQALVGAEISLDGHTLPSERLGVATPVDPGHHVVRSRLGTAEASRELDLAEGADQRIDAPVPAPHITTSTPPAGDAAGHQEERMRTDIVERPRSAATRAPARPSSQGGVSWPFVLGGAGLVGGGVALDLAPASARNGQLDVLDLVPLGLYAGGAVLTAVGLLQ